MKEEDIDKRIVRVIRDVSSKNEEMARWEQAYEINHKPSDKFRRKLRIYGSVAASVLIVGAVGISIYFAQNQYGERGVIKSGGEIGMNSATPVFRGASSDAEGIEEMIETGNYGEAISAIDRLLADTLIDESLPGGQKEYFRSLNRLMAYDLTWLKIKALVKLDHIDEAVLLLEAYCQEEGENKAEAQKMLEKLNR